MKNGLIPQTGLRCNSIGDDSQGVFFSKGIDKSIVMYSLMLSFYEKYVGAEGDKIILENFNAINELKNSKDYIRFPEIANIDIKYHLSLIERANLIKGCGNFINYLGGNGCFLSVNDLDGIDDNFPENCCYCHIVPPSKINVVNIRNKFTNE